MQLLKKSYDGPKCCEDNFAEPIAVLFLGMRRRVRKENTRNRLHYHLGLEIYMIYCSHLIGSTGEPFRSIKKFPFRRVFQTRKIACSRLFVEGFAAPGAVLVSHEA